jgi:hypothetical protein
VVCTKTDPISRQGEQDRQWCSDPPLRKEVH